MAVDVKSLRVGSHVEYKGKRGRILYVAPGGDFMNCGIHTTDDCGLPANYHISGFEQIHPIPITPSLLKELGFVRKPNADKKRYFDFLWEREDVESDDTCWEHCEKDNFFLLHSGAFGQLNVKYLHEAEAFLALHGVELIKENKNN